MRDLGSIPESGRSPGEGNGNPLQYSCLENSRDRGAWGATVHGVTMSWTCLSDKHFLKCCYEKQSWFINWSGDKLLLHAENNQLALASLIYLPSPCQINKCFREEFSWYFYHCWAGFSSASVGVHMYFHQTLWTLNTGKKQGHPLGNQSRNLLTCHKHMLYYCVELEAVTYLQMSSNWLSRKPEVLICRVCHLYKYSHQG